MHVDVVRKKRNWVGWRTIDQALYPVVSRLSSDASSGQAGLETISVLIASRETLPSDAFACVLISSC